MSDLGKELPSPVDQQIQLISIYRAIPMRSAASGRMSRAIGEQDLSIVPQEQAEYLAEVAFSTALEHTRSAELPVQKIELLKKLLDQARITKVSKELILADFQLNFALGFDESWDIFRSLGLTDENRMETGIFSQNAETRKKIERDIYREHVLTLEDLKNDPKPEEVEEDLKLEETRLDAHAEQFYALYNEPIESTPTS